MLSNEINTTITQFARAFNDNDLDRVMTFFSEDAIYKPGDGRTHKGKAEIRAALEPQFAGAYGAMRFDERDRIIDAENGKAAFRWVCTHDISKVTPMGVARFIQKTLATLTLGERFGWQGIDVFHFDNSGKIKGKFSYAWFGSRPHLQRSLG